MVRKSDRETILLVVERLVAEYAPQKVILLGSHTRETAHRDSDIDLLIIKDTQESFVGRMAAVRQAVSGTHKGIPFDPLVLTPSEVQARVKAGDQFIAEILERGEVLYAA